MTDIVLREKTNNVLCNADAFDHCFRIAEVFAQSDIVPVHFRRKPANVFVALQMAERLGLDAMVALQNIFMIKDRPCLSSQILISLVNTSGVIDGCIVFESNNKAVPELIVTARAKLKTGEIVSSSFSYKQAQEFGVTNNTPWRGMPEQMCRYRAASMLIKSYFPQVVMGLSAKEELEEVEDFERNTNTKRVVELDFLEIKEEPTPAIQAAPAMQTKKEIVEVEF